MPMYYYIIILGLQGIYIIMGGNGKMKLLFIYIGMEFGINYSMWLSNNTLNIRYFALIQYAI